MLLGFWGRAVRHMAHVARHPNATNFLYGRALLQGRCNLLPSRGVAVAELSSLTWDPPWSIEAMKEGYATERHGMCHFPRHRTVARITNDPAASASSMHVVACSFAIPRFHRLLEMVTAQPTSRLFWDRRSCAQLNGAPKLGDDCSIVSPLLNSLFVGSLKLWPCREHRHATISTMRSLPMVVV